MHLSQLKGGGVVVREGETARLVPGAETVLDLAHCLKEGRGLITLATVAPPALVRA